MKCDFFSRTGAVDSFASPADLLDEVISFGQT